MEQITEIIAIIDRSGSMSSVLDDAIGGFNTFIENQKNEDGRANFTLIQFNHDYEVVCNGIDIKEAPSYDRKTYVPSGNTALLDAVGKGINEVTARTAGLNNKVMIAILTDGHENSSREFTLAQVKTLIDQRKSEGWEFVFLAAGPEAFDMEHFAGAMGISKDKYYMIMDKKKVAEAYINISNAATEFRKTGKLKDEEWKNKMQG